MLINMHPRNVLIFFLFSVAVLLLDRRPFALASIVSINFPSFTLRNFTLLGDSYIKNGVIGLTKEISVPSSSSGTFIYDSPIGFFDSEFNITASFSTRFSFSITNKNPTSYGDGLTFFLSPEKQPLGSPGEYLGLVNSSQLTKNNFVAVEFDTKLDLHFSDPNDNHVGLDVDSLNSIKTADPISQGVVLRSGTPITAWIDYKNEEKKLMVFLSYSSLKPEEPILVVDIDLSDYLKELMYAGFSASTEGSTEIHLIQNWSFCTIGFSRVRPRIHPHNVSEHSVTPIPISNSTDRHHKRLALGLGIAGPAFFCVALAVFGWISFWKWKGVRAENNFKPEIVTGPRQFSFKELMSATKGFHSSRIIGHGAFGTVYKAYLLESSVVSAVKRSKRTHEGKNEFVAELSVIACLRHKNLVQLQGFCFERGELLLVYEYMSNGTLDDALYDESEKGEPLKWSYRYNIAVGLASVLSYLHQECEQQVIHRDIKTSNVMLDANFNARLGDFGLARFMDHDKSPVSTLTAGTMGYLAPEYLQYGIATEKSDIFSYGVVVLEVACGSRPILDKMDGKKTVNLVDWVWELYSEGNIMEVADKRLKGQFDEEEMKKLIMVGLSCANPDSEARPTMRKVLHILNGEVDPVIVPKMKPTLTFSSSLPRLEEIFSDDEEMDSLGSAFEIIVDS